MTCDDPGKGTWWTFIPFQWSAISATHALRHGNNQGLRNNSLPKLGDRHGSGSPSCRHSSLHRDGDAGIIGIELLSDRSPRSAKDGSARAGSSSEYLGYDRFH